MLVCENDLKRETIPLVYNEIGLGEWVGRTNVPSNIDGSPWNTSQQ